MLLLLLGGIPVHLHLDLDNPLQELVHHCILVLLVSLVDLGNFLFCLLFDF